MNDYLAKRDAEWMGKIYEFLGLTVGVIVHDLDDNERRAAYAADITYGTNNEFGFDYLRDNMKFEIKDCVQRGHYYAIVDEVDSILIDEARTPLIISGPTDQTTDKYARVRKIIPQLVMGEEIESTDHKRQEELGIQLAEGQKYLTGDYIVDEKQRTIGVTDEGWVTIEKLLGIDNIADAENWELKHYVETAIKAHALYKRDVEYVVKDGEVIIVDTFTGRLMPGRRWSDGLHQSIEAKEGVNIRKEDQTLATITFQNYFRLYKKLSGMTGTAETEAAEFEKIYKLEIVVIPTNKPMLRLENPDVVYRTEKEKYKAVGRRHRQAAREAAAGAGGHHVDRKIERLSGILQRKGVRHVVLNAKFHEREAEIVAQAGRLGMVTIATNMAGRGTDILLGGNPEFMARQELVKKGNARAISVAEGAINPMAPAGFLRFYYQGQEFEVSDADWAESNKGHAETALKDHEQVIAVGGLFILGTERHESRRIDNQLRGRAGRQGDPGESRFYFSLEDDLMRIFAKQWVSTLLERLGMEEGVPIESKMISKRIEGAQKAVEAQNFESRKHLLEYDDVMNKQREAVYGLRRQLLEGVDQRELILEDYVGGILSGFLDEFAGEQVRPDQWNIKGLEEKLVDQFGLNLSGVGLQAAGAQPPRAGRGDLRETEAAIRGQGKNPGRRDHALPRADGDAERDRRALEGSSAFNGSPERGDRPARLCAAGSAGGIQAGVLRYVRSHDAEVPGRHSPIPLPDADSRARRAADGRAAAAETARFPRLRRWPLPPCRSPSMPSRERSGFTPASLPPPSTRWRRSSTARSSGSWMPPADREAATRASPRSAAPAKRWAATIPAPAEAERSTRNATGLKDS